MKIAHINNISGVASILSKYQRQQGLEVDVFVFNKTIYEQFGGILINYKSPFSRWNILKKLKKHYDVLHYHYPYGSLKRSLEKLNKEKIYLKHYHGNDIRGKYDPDPCLVSTPDLLQYAPNGIWLPNPVDIDEINQIVTNRDLDNRNGPLRLAHYPYYKNYPSTFTDYYSETLSSVKRENKCEILEIFRLSNQETLQLIAYSDIVIGKILPDVGWFGKFELEAMALGKPVIAYVSDELFEKYKPPIFRTTKNTFQEDLKYLIENDQQRHRLTNEGPAYIRKNHSIADIIATINRYYRN
ncbi:glycosyltransferase [Candidatus Nitrosocosmicus sp. R]